MVFAPFRGMNTGDIRLFLCGDVMTGRGIDQIQRFPSDSRIYEPYIHHSEDYIRLAEQVNGAISTPVDWTYIWGDAFEELNRRSPDFRIINLETAVTRSREPWPEKVIQYKMEPRNIRCITDAGIGCCVLANNHVLDWGIQGFRETLEVLSAKGIKHCGAGTTLTEATRPAILTASNGARISVLSVGISSSGIPEEWGARHNREGVFYLPDTSEYSLSILSDVIEDQVSDDSVLLLSVHWGGNWGFPIPPDMQSFAHECIDQLGVDIIHGHSSHHPKAIEVHRGKPILYGCGDFINDYEGIQGYEHYRGDLAVMYFLDFDAEYRHLRSLDLFPMKRRRFRLEKANDADVSWLADMLVREGAFLGTSVEDTGELVLRLKWKSTKETATSGARDG